MAGIINIETGEALKGIGEGVGGIAKGIGGLLKDIRAAITGKEILDPTKLAEIEARLMEMEAQAMNSQVELNKIEAASPSLFKSGWRPAAGWLCVTGLAWSTFIYPIWIWIANLYTKILPPALNVEVLISLLIAMLGLGGFRTYEKTRNGKNGK
jgi:hypothetical protein